MLSKATAVLSAMLVQGLPGHQALALPNSTVLSQPCILALLAYAEFLSTVGQTMIERFGPQINLLHSHGLSLVLKLVDKQPGSQAAAASSSTTSRQGQISCTAIIVKGLTSIESCKASELSLTLQELHVSQGQDGGALQCVLKHKLEQQAVALRAVRLCHRAAQHVSIYACAVPQLRLRLCPSLPLCLSWHWCIVCCRWRVRRGSLQAVLKHEVHSHRGS